MFYLMNHVAGLLSLYLLQGNLQLNLGFISSWVSWASCHSLEHQFYLFFIWLLLWLLFVSTRSLHANDVLKKCLHCFGLRKLLYFILKQVETTLYICCTTVLGICPTYNNTPSFSWRISWTITGMLIPQELVSRKPVWTMCSCLPGHLDWNWGSYLIPAELHRFFPPEIWNWDLTNIMIHWARYSNT